MGEKEEKSKGCNKQKEREREKEIKGSVIIGTKEKKREHMRGGQERNLKR